MEAIKNSSNTFLDKIFLNKWFWVFFTATMFALPIYKSVNRQLPPEIPKQFQIADFKLTDEMGKPFQWSSLRGRFVMVSFYFTRCPSICRELMTKMQEIEKRVRGLGDKVAILSITVDPEFDQPSVIFPYARSLKANPLIWKFLTGNKDEVTQVVTKQFISPMEASKDQSVFDIAHTGSIYLVDDEGWLRSTYSTKKSDVDKMMIDLGLMVNRLYYKK